VTVLQVIMMVNSLYSYVRSTQELVVDLVIVSEIVACLD